MINQMNDAECNHETRRLVVDDDTAICALLQDVLSELSLRFQSAIPDRRPYCVLRAS